MELEIFITMFLEPLAVIAVELGLWPFEWAALLTLLI